MLLMPITGYLGASFGGDGIDFFGGPAPDWASKNEALKERFFAAHSIIAWILVGFVSVHVLGAFKYLWIDKDRVFRRMLPWLQVRVLLAIVSGAVVPETLACGPHCARGALSRS